MAARAQYGANPHADRNPNADNGWGGHQWPAGVPASLLAVVTVPGGVRIVVRKELAELVALNYQIADKKYGRQFTRGWTGGYENRAITGTRTPSNHSKGKAIDNDAQDNPMSSSFVTNLPTGLVADWESTGWYWGGRYTGKADTMHFEYCYSPGDVPGHVARARQILANLNPPKQTAVAVPEGGPSYPGLLQRGSKGDAVRTMQARLVLHLVNGYGKTIATDGDFGPGTEAAVRWFQSARSLGTDGIVGPTTWRSLWQ